MSLLEKLFDDAAIFPPGNLPLAQAIPAHVGHLTGPRARYVGPLVVEAAALSELAGLALPDDGLEVSLTVPAPSRVVEALAEAASIGGARVVALEVALPNDLDIGAVVPDLDAALVGPEVPIFVELPRDRRRPTLVKALGGTRYSGKVRTGGVRAELYPDEAELAAVLVDTARAGVPIKATAGLHHPLRNTDPATGFEQHGFLNLLAAVGAALTGDDEAAVAALLAERDAEAVLSRVRSLEKRSDAVRHQFRSLGTCSIVEPLADLAALGAVDLPEGALA